MSHVAQIKIPATYIRGGTSKGVFFKLTDLPERCQVPGEARDKLLLRVIGSRTRMRRTSTAWGVLRPARPSA